ncbi:hypothetical protein GWI33_012769 [Rhynchophorus ferrugineus]|uniref:Uncharacterized protein n=1 Tax=Rhynchophorus ferrugineus TaxID=354439 RepID=A0A834IAU6_RHYFE|nr:hypothetical protein GWI33_012769 [Rhynchophorus ferrugineus]
MSVRTTVSGRTELIRLIYGRYENVQAGIREKVRSASATRNGTDEENHDKQPVIIIVKLRHSFVDFSVKREQVTTKECCSFTPLDRFVLNPNDLVRMIGRIGRIPQKNQQNDERERVRSPKTVKIAATTAYIGARRLGMRSFQQYRHFRSLERGY